MDFTEFASSLWYPGKEAEGEKSSERTKRPDPPSFLGTLFTNNNELDLGIGAYLSGESTADASSDTRSIQTSLDSRENSLGTSSSRRAQNPAASERIQSLPDGRTCQSEGDIRKAVSDDLERSSPRRRQGSVSKRSTPDRSERIRDRITVVTAPNVLSTPKRSSGKKQESGDSPRTLESSECSSSTNDESDELNPYNVADAMTDRLNDLVSEEEEEDAVARSLAYHEDRVIFSVPSRTSTSNPNFSLRSTEREALLRKQKHFSPCAFGRLYTIASIVFALSGIGLSVFAQRSVAFVRVEKPFEISPQMEEVEFLGLVRTRLCYNNSVATSGRLLLSEEENPFTRRLDDLRELSSTELLDDAEPICFNLELTTEIVHDIMWNIARFFLSLAIAFGSFLSIMLLLSIYWETINLKPVAIGMLFTYFFQSLSFFFFDSSICRENLCRLSQGSFASILASLCWFLSALAVIRMDVLYQAQLRVFARRRKRAIKKLKLQHKYSTGTATTTSSGASPEPQNLTFIFDEEAQEVVDLRSWIGMSEDEGDDIILGGSDLDFGASYEI